MEREKHDEATGLSEGASMPVLEPLIAVNQRGFAAAVEAQTHLLRRMAEISAEMFEFMGRRLERDQAALAGLVECKSPVDAATVCYEFYETSMRQYGEEAGKLAALCALQAPEAIEDVLHQIEETVDPAVHPGPGDTAASGH